MANLKLSAQKRESRPKPHQLLLQDIIPATVYGANEEARTIQMEKKEFDTIYSQAGQTSLIDLSIADAKQSKPVLIHQLQKNPLTGEVIHVEFYQVNLSEKVTTDVPIELIGEAPAIKLGAVPYQNLQTLQVECLPQYLISQVEVDISSIEQINDEVTVADIKVPAEITVLVEPTEIVFRALPPQAEEEEEEIEDEVAEGGVTEPEVLTEKKDEAEGGSGD